MITSTRVVLSIGVLSFFQLRLRTTWRMYTRARMTPRTLLSEIGATHRVPAVQLVRLETYNNVYYNLASVLTVNTAWYISWSKLTVQQWMWNKNNCPAGCALAKLSRPLKGVDFRFLPLVLRLNNFSYFSLRKIIKHRYHATERPFPNEHVYYNFCR